MGAVLILSALLLFACNLRENIRAGQEAESLLADVRAAIAAPPAAAPPPPNRLPPPPRNQMIRTRNPNGNLDSDHFLFGAGNRTRTCTLLAVEPKSTESTNSTMPAFLALCRDGTPLF